MNIFQNSKHWGIIWQFARFALIGLAAACTHFYVALHLVEIQMSLAMANLFGFAVAFWLSYFGHRYFTFAGQHTTHRKTLLKFMLVAVSGFLLNEAIVLFLRAVCFFPVSHSLILAIVLTAIVTFLMNRYFAFDPEA